MSLPLRIHWVSPLPPQETDIAHYTRRILPALAAQGQVVLWTDTPGWDPELEQFAEVRLFDSKAHLPMDFARDPDEEPHVDAIFYHVGNSGLFHGGILDLASRVPGIVVLHDLAIQELLRHLVLDGQMDARRYREAMIRHHGGEGRVAAQRILDHGPPTELLVQMPMFQIALERATAALCHTPAGFDAVEESGLVPVYHADLPFAVGPEVDSARAPDGPLRLVQFGHIGPNRRLDEVLEALAEIRRDVPFVLDLFGKIWEADRIARRIRELGIATHVRLRGFAPEAELDAALREAHLVFNLRFPTLGEASGSQVRIWNASATSVVTDLGWYATMPDNCVLKIPLDGEISALVATLRRLDADRGMCARIGAAGRAQLLARHTPERYAEAIADIARNSVVDTHERLLVDSARTLLQAAGPAARPYYARRLAALF